MPLFGDAHVDRFAVRQQLRVVVQSLLKFAENIQRRVITYN